MGLCKCAKKKVTNIFCFEHNVNVCEHCLVSDHERCIVQSYVQWLQDSDYNPICILCKNLLKDEETIRLVCYDVFHLNCLNKYASQLPADTAPAGYQCPKCKECLFPPNNLVSPVVDVLKQKIQNMTWSRIGLGQSLLPSDDFTSNDSLNIEIEEQAKEEMIKQSANNEDETNGFVIVNEQLQIKNDKNISNNESIDPLLNEQNTSKVTYSNPQIIQNNVPNVNEAQLDLDHIYTEQNETNISHNRAQQIHTSSKYEIDNNFDNNRSSSYYDSSSGMILNLGQDRDTGDYKYQRRPLFEWLNRWLKSRQLLKKVRMTRRKKYLFIIIIILISLFTLIIIFSQLGSISTEDDPAFDPMNNPNIRVQ